MRILSGIVLVLLLIVLIIFCIQNFQPIEVAFLGSKLKVPTPVLVIGTYILGTISGWGLWGLVRRSVAEVTKKPHQV